MAPEVENQLHILLYHLKQQENVLRWLNGKFVEGICTLTVELTLCQMGFEKKDKYQISYDKKGLVPMEKSQ